MQASLRRSYESGVSYLRPRASDVRRALRFYSHAGEVKRARDELRRLPAANAYDFADRHVPGGCHQLPAEIVPFLSRVRDLRPKRICEIGCANGATTLALSHSAPTVELMIGVDLFVRNRAILRALRRPQQRMAFVDGPSLSPRALARVRQALRGAALDVLLIDGDHSYDGALGDFLAYGEMVRDGGLIALHDIVPDAYPQHVGTARRARLTMPPQPGVAWSGDVPRLWEALSARFEHETYVADPGQHGYGIGVLEYRHDRVDGALRDALVATTP